VRNGEEVWQGAKGVCRRIVTTTTPSLGENWFQLICGVDSQLQEVSMWHRHVLQRCLLQ
jgi:hypothetical protein